MELINLKSLNLTMEESRDITPNLKRKNKTKTNKNTTKTNKNTQKI